jgi:hypothetical protein
MASRVSRVSLSKQPNKLARTNRGKAAVATRIELSRMQKALLVWSVAFCILAESAKYLSFDVKAAARIGLIEVLLAIATGIAFGVSASIRKD